MDQSYIKHLRINHGAKITYEQGRTVIEVRNFNIPVSIQKSLQLNIAEEWYCLLEKIEELVEDKRESLEFELASDARPVIYKVKTAFENEGFTTSINGRIVLLKKHE